MIDKFLYSQDYADSTIDRYGRYLRDWTAWLEGEGIELADAGPGDAAQWLNTKNWGNSMRYVAAMCLRSFYRFTFGDDHAFASYKLKRKDPGPQRTLAQSEVDKLYEALNGETRGPVSEAKQVRDRAMISLALDTGLRSREICSLKMCDVDLDRLQGSALVKGGDRRRIVFTETTADRLRMWFKFRTFYTECDRVFCSLGGGAIGEPLTIDGLRVIIRNLAKKAGVEHFSPHALRRTMATLMIENGASTRFVQLAGGWHSLRMLERYTQQLALDGARKYMPS